MVRKQHLYWILGCFDNIKHSALLEKLNTTPTLKGIIKGWLKAGIMEDRKFSPTKRGTIQGGTISPLLACVALYRLEQNIKEELKEELFQYAKKKYGRVSRKQALNSVSVITYAGDFVVLHESEELVLKAKVLIEKWLKPVGLELKSSKTRIAHTLKSLNGEKPGFDFLGFSIRHYQTRQNKRGYKLLIKPSRKSISQHLLSIKHKLKELQAAPQEAVIKELNPIIRGWSQYYTSVVSSKVFNLLRGCNSLDLI
ncbi:reverse transcriptase domain-containing protein [Wolbachia endosymbiont of Diaphorina citri]|uniref:reverse transcriptase domain-containing protein n=1 Tax=Wolbachia endosymbiont of Diaphorina citri TaxID=116598 RepID=UPI0015987C74|nr:reverse transcriptase domain-containing protein [Wolbachia endosymbiont of Diaphorina citri]QLK11815.1 hypothetical protein FK497_06420 [Wolbachia endosymbiont of Diaphorina citri]